MRKQAFTSALAATALFALAGFAIAQTVGGPVQSLRGADVDEQVNVPDNFTQEKKRFTRNYRQQLRIYERHTANAGLSKMHGLRHAYAQQRYQELTGWRAPAAGGPIAKALTAEQKRIDQAARLTISLELGHERIQVVGIYLGN